MTATYSRVIMAPLLFASFYLFPVWGGWIAGVLFILGSITDGLDGYWARKYASESNMGKLMDPVADKILVLAALVLLLSLERVHVQLVFWLLARDILIGGLRSVAAANQMIIAAKPFGKWKTGLQMVGVPMLLIHINLLSLPFIEMGGLLLWISLVLSMISAVQYIMGYLKARPAA